MYDPLAEYDEKVWREKYMVEVYPYLKEHGPEIGEKAMQGDSLAELIIRRTAMFQTNYHPENYRLLVGHLKDWTNKKAH